MTMLPNPAALEAYYRADDRESAFRFISAQTEAHELRFKTIHIRMVRELKGLISPEAIRRALIFGDVEVALIARVSERTSAFMFADTLEGFSASFGDAARAAASLDTNNALLFDTFHPRAIRFAETNATRFAEGIAESSIKSIRNSIAQAIRDGENPAVAARRIRSMVGLTDPHRVAVDRFYKKALERGVKPVRALRNQQQYAQRLIRYRSENIARTEMLSAANAGQQEYWLQLNDAGIINGQTITKEWVTAGDDRTCEQCAPMDGEQVTGLTTQWESSVLGVGDRNRSRPGASEFRDYPPLHNMCRCTVILL